MKKAAQADNRGVDEIENEVVSQHHVFVNVLMDSLKTSGLWNEAIEWFQKEVAALYLKSCGNLEFKHKNYSKAVKVYTDAINMKCEDVDVKATLFNNRSAANYFLKNYRSSLDDCLVALELKPQYMKPLVRSANCYYMLEQYQKCLITCVKILQMEPDNKEILKLKLECIEADKYKQKRSDKTGKTMDDLLLEEILKRGIKIHCKNDLEPHDASLAGHRVYLDESNNLMWPVMLLHHGFKEKITVCNFCEYETIVGYICMNIPKWTMGSRQNLKNLEVFCYTGPGSETVEIDIRSNLLEILKTKSFVMRGGLPIITLVPKGHFDGVMECIARILYQSTGIQ